MIIKYIGENVKTFSRLGMHTVNFDDSTIFCHQTVRIKNLNPTTNLHFINTILCQILDH